MSAPEKEKPHSWKETIVGMPVRVLGEFAEARSREPQGRRALVLGGVAALGLVIGFSVVVSLTSPASRAKESAVGIARQLRPPAPEGGAPVFDPQAGGVPLAAEAPDDVSSVAPVAAAPEAVPPAAVTTPTPKPSSGHPPSPPPTSAPAGPCNPPYRFDFFGHRVLKPGCS